MAKVTPNRDQQKAIDTIDGPVLISAGPGTGRRPLWLNDMPIW